MPEIIEVRIFAETLHRDFHGKTLLNIDSDSKIHNKLKGVDNLKLPAKLLGVNCYGKKVIFVFENGQYLVNAPLMDGRWVYTPANNNKLVFNFGASAAISPKANDTKDLKTIVATDTKDVKAPATTSATTPTATTPTITTPSATTPTIMPIFALNIVQHKLYYDGARIYGGLEYTTDIKQYLSKLGPDPFYTVITTELWRKIFRTPKVQKWEISKAIIDPSLIAGIGNWMKAEILYESKISPYRLVGNMSDSELETCRKWFLYVTEQAYKSKGLTLATYWSPDGVAGTYPRKVYSKPTDPFGNVVQKDVTAGKRAHHWVPGLQK
jgi:formamidopyrimidine-DNA glycosylase